MPVYATEQHSARLLIPCRLHGALHPVPDVYFACDHTNYAVTVQEFGWVLLAATSATCQSWTLARDAHSRRLRFSWNSPVQNLILTARALGTPARFRAMLADAAAVSVPDFRTGFSLADNICRLHCRTHGWESVTDLYPVTADSLEPLARIIAQLGVVLAAPRFTTCEQIQLSYERLLDEISNPPDVINWDDVGTAQDAYLHAARVLHRFLSDPIVYATTRSLEGPARVSSRHSARRPAGAGAAPRLSQSAFIFRRLSSCPISTSSPNAQNAATV